MLLDVDDIVAALHASECSQDEFWLGVSGPRDGTVYAHQSAEIERSQLPDLRNLWQVIYRNGEIALFDGVLVIIVSVCCHESLEPIAEIWLVLVERSHQIFHELRPSMWKSSNMVEINIHGELLLLSHSSRLMSIVSDWLSRFHVDTVRISRVIWIILPQFETIRAKEYDLQKMIKNTYFSKKW